MTLMLLKRRDEAIEYYTCAAAIEPDHAQVQWGLAQALIASGRLDAAIAPLEAALRLDSNNPEAHYWLANALAGRGDMQGAVRGIMPPLCKCGPTTTRRG